MRKPIEKECRVKKSPPSVQPSLVLASASERRRNLLEQINVVPNLIDPANLEEARRKGESPRALAERLAREKAATVAERHRGAIVLGADTVVACGRRILPKAESPEQARHCLELLSGRRHLVVSAISLVSPVGAMRSRLVVTAVRFKRLNAVEVEAYLQTCEWQGKAGGYAIQGHAAIFVAWINGSYSNIVGLPLFETHAMLTSAGLTGLRLPSD